MAIKKDDVFRVCDAMFADGVAPSLVLVRTALGSGSYSTISGYLTEWKSASRSAPVVGVDDAPDEVNEIFSVALRSMWAVAQANALAEFDSQKLEFLAKIADLILKEKDALELAQQLQSDCDGYMNKSLSYAEELDEMKAVNFDMAKVVTACKSREHELRAQHTLLLSKIGPITIRKERVPAAVKVVKKA